MKKKYPYRHRYKSFRCSERLFRKIDEAAEQAEVTASEFIREALVFHLKRLKRARFYDPLYPREEVIREKEKGNSLR